MVGSVRVRVGYFRLTDSVTLNLSVGKVVTSPPFMRMLLLGSLEARLSVVVGDATNIASSLASSRRLLLAFPCTRVDLCNTPAVVVGGSQNAAVGWDNGRGFRGCRVYPGDACYVLSNALPQSRQINPSERWPLLLPSLPLLCVWGPLLGRDCNVGFGIVRTPS